MNVLAIWAYKLYNTYYKTVLSTPSSDVKPGAGKWITLKSCGVLPVKISELLKTTAFMRRTGLKI